MHTIVITLHYLVCIFLIAIILLQAGKGADIGAAFGGASQTIFGSRGPATFLNKLTTLMTVVFLCTSIFLAQYAKKHSIESVIDDKKITDVEKAPISPEKALEEEVAEELKTGAPAKDGQEKEAGKKR